MQHLLSIPPAACDALDAFEQFTGPDWYATSDPPGARLGSGGGTVHLLLEAWRQTGQGQALWQWLAQSRKLMVHGGGQSRRLPAYAPAGKLFIPVPVWRWSTGQRIDQTLLDLQLPYLRRLFDRAPATSRLMIASGDVLVRFTKPLPPMPDVDVLCVGLWGTPEDAQHFGVFFTERQHPDRLAFFLQKPSPDRIRELAAGHVFLLDAGIWMLSERAVRVLLKLGGATADESLDALAPQPFELYSDFGLGLGDHPVQSDGDLNALSCGIVSLPDGEFHHFGRTRDLLQSCLTLQNLVLDQREMRPTPVKVHPDLFVQNAAIHCEWQPHNHRIWVENSVIGPHWCLHSDHVVTGAPDNDWSVDLPPGLCLDFIPAANLAVRPYGMDDAFRGPVGDPDTYWLGRPCSEWFETRQIQWQDAAIDPATDIQMAPLFVLVPRGELDGPFLQWLVARNPAPDATFRDRWLSLPRLSADELGRAANLPQLYRQRHARLAENLPELAANFQNSVFYRTDLKHLASLYVQNDIPLPPPVEEQAADTMTVVHDRMFRAEVARHRINEPQAHEPAPHPADAGPRAPESPSHEAEAFALLRNTITTPVRENPVLPQCDTAPDQIVWARCPVRLDLAGGWTDTPPYCLVHGGGVVNLAVNLNGQPPLQAFVKRCADPHIVVRSIDLGIQRTLRTYQELGDYNRVDSEFAIAKAALALVGFEPGFCSAAFASLEEQLSALGGGLELSFVAAIPKGSGLGTSSALAATILGALNDFCALNWDKTTICNRVLALEQMLTSGGGWQDQYGAVLHGVKLVETEPGMDQTPSIKWSPEHLLREGTDNQTILLYYTGMTRVAKNILQEIVRGMFLNHRERLDVLAEIRTHAETTYDALQKSNWDRLCAAVDRSWQLNQRLDSGTNPPAVQTLLEQVNPWIAGAKLLGAGGGGYMLLFAKDRDAAIRIRQTLTDAPPNPRARFVNMDVSTTGLQVTRS